MTNELNKIIIRGSLRACTTTLLVISVVQVWSGDLIPAGLLLLALMITNIFYNGLAYTIFWGLCGSGVLLLGYEKKVLGVGFLVLAAVILTANLILWIKAIKRDGKLALLRIKITPDRPSLYARKDFNNENDITCILWNKLKKS